MSVEETILFVTVIVLAFALVVVVVAPKVRAGRRRRDEGVAVAVAAGEYGMGHPDRAPVDDGAAVVLPEPPLVSTAKPPPAPPGASGHLICPTCRRQFAVGLRFCPYDARLLTPEPPAGPALDEREPSTDPELKVPAGKICPTCARRYEIVAVVCARDGAPLVSVN